MPGFLGGSSGSSGSSGEITFPKEFIDPVTKLRVSQPENLIDTDFEYGLQPTKWETVELINNTPSFFSKSGDTTIPGITSIATNNGTREITVTTATDHGLAVGIPINVTGTKSVTADGSYVINSIPNTSTFTYLCKDEQSGNNAIEDLYTSIITGEFFQGSQIRIADAEGVTTDAEPVSTLTVKTDSTHGFGLNTPFYFLNLNSTISQEFEASNTAAKSFDSSNSATAQTFDGSNTLSTFNIDWSNSATVGGTTSTLSSVDTVNDTITVTHGAETFANQPLGTPLYYNLTVAASSGYFLTNPRGVVFLKTTDSLNVGGQSTFKVSAIPDGDVIDIVSSMSGTFQLANQARTFAGNNVNALTEITLPIIKNAAVAFDGANNGLIGSEPQANTLATVVSYSGSLINVSTTASAGLVLYSGAMVRYSTTGSAASGLTNNTTYFIDTFFSTGTDTYSFTIKPLPNGTAITSISGGTGTQTFTRIGVSVDKDIVHVRNANFLKGEMVKYTFPASGNFGADSQLNYYFIDTAYDNHNFKLSDSLDSITVATGGTVTQVVERGSTWNVHTFTTVGSTNFVVSALSNEATVEFLLVGGGGGGMVNAGSGGGGGVVIRGTTTLAGAGTYPVVVGDGGTRGSGGYDGNHVAGGTGGSTTFNGITATGGAGGVGYSSRNGGTAGNGSGGADPAGLGGQGVAPSLPAGTTGTVYGGNRGGNSAGGGHRAGGGAGAGGNSPNNLGFGGPGVRDDIDGNTYFYGGGGGGGTWAFAPYAGGIGGGGGGGVQSTWTAGQGGRGGRNNGGNGKTETNATASGGSGGANTGGGGGGGTFYGTSGATGGLGGSGIAIIRYRATPVAAAIAPVASGGTITSQTINGVTYRVHTYLSGSSTFVVTDPGNIGKVEILVVGGGGGGGWDVGGGGGGGGVLYASNFQLAAQTYNISIGTGGSGSSSGSVRGVSGNNTTFGSATAYGGGGAGSWSNTVGADGGSGGGTTSNRAESHYSNQTNFTGFAGLGYPGGAGANNTSNQNNYAGAAGGGGAGGPGGHGDAGAFGANSSQYQFGGAGFASNIRTGTTAYYGTGGPGASDGNSHYGAAATGGTSIEQSAAANTGGGGGGGGSSNTGGTGGSGIVVIRYPLAFPA
jgi:hypothetical protein